MGCAASCVCKTIKAGEYYAVSDRSGNVKVIEGPSRLCRCGRFFESINLEVAGENEYLELKFLDGRTEFRPGPASAVRNPIEHVSITRHRVKRLAKGEVLLIYREEHGSTGKIFLEGPGVYRPTTASEWTVPMNMKVATDSEYLAVTHIDGHVEIQRGPASLIVDPEKYLTVEVQSAVQIGEQELIVVYRRTGDEVKRYLVRGPCLYIPDSASEWTHEFSWTGAAAKSETISGPARKQVDAIKFTKLRTSPGKMYYDVENVRTKDNALLAVRLMLFFEYTDVEMMLNNTNDPYGDFVNAVSADIIEWCSSKKFDEFLAATENLNTLDMYKQLVANASKIGMKMQKVVFRGYEAPKALQSMHDTAIEKRTELALSREREEDEQKLLDFKLKKEEERSAKQHELEMSKLSHDLSMQKKQFESKQQELEMQRDLEIEKIRQIKNIDRNADVVKYLIAKEGKLPNIVQCATMLAPPAMEIDGMQQTPGGWCG